MENRLVGNYIKYINIDVEQHENENVLRLLVCNKVDLENKREVTSEEGKELSDSLNLSFIGTYCN